MKKIFSKAALLLSVTAGLLTSCVSEDNFDIPAVRDPFFKEDFQTVTNNTDLDLPGWTNFAEAGSKLWREKTFTSGGVTNGYAEFSAFNSAEASNKVWLISPAINMDTYAKEKLAFSVCQHHLDVDSPGNSLQVFVSTNYDGTNVLAATWTPVNANIPTKSAAWYAFYKSVVDMSGYTGNVHVAFKFTGSGTDTTLDGAFQVDDFYMYNEN